jgi:hypothetical protein
MMLLAPSSTACVVDGMEVMDVEISVRDNGGYSPARSDEKRISTPYSKVRCRKRIII